MHERARQLDQSLVEIAAGFLALRQPEMFQHIVRFVKQSPIEKIEVSQVMRVTALAGKPFDERGDLLTLAAHARWSTVNSSLSLSTIACTCVCVGGLEIVNDRPGTLLTFPAVALSICVNV